MTIAEVIPAATAAALLRLADEARQAELKRLSSALPPADEASRACAWRP
jgi:hypothetical protein